MNIKEGRGVIEFTTLDGLKLMRYGFSWAVVDVQLAVKEALGQGVIMGC